MSWDNIKVHPTITQQSIQFLEIPEVTAYSWLDRPGIPTPQCSYIDEGSVKEDLVATSASWDTEAWGTSACLLWGYNSTFHAYNPPTGQGWLNITSINAVEYGNDIWLDARNDYASDNFGDAYFKLGRLCHLLEDMSSPAHVQIDPHLTVADVEEWGKLNYSPELYPPQVIRKPSSHGDDSLSANTFENFMKNLAWQTYRSTSFQGKLIEEFGNNVQPDCELKRMFPDIEYMDDWYTTDYWVIPEVGWYFNGLGNNEWWLCEGNNDDGTGYFYLENLNQEDGGPDFPNPGEYITAKVRRSNFFERINDGDNLDEKLISNNDIRLIDLYATNLFPLATEWVAGLIQFFYDPFPPTVSYTEQSIYVGTEILVAFSEEMRPTSFTNNSIIVSGASSGIHECSFIYNSTTKELIIDPLINFDYDESVAVTITTDVMDLAKNGIDGNNDGTSGPNYVFSFTTQPQPGGEPTAINITASVSPNINVNAYSTIGLTGTANYNTGDQVDFGTVYINTGTNVYTAFIYDGNFNINAQAPAFSGNIKFNVSEPKYKFTSSTSKAISINSLARISLKVLLEGPYKDDKQMNMARYNIPLISPFEEDQKEVGSIPTGVVDWILVKLRSKYNSSTVVQSRSGFLLDNGYIVDIDGHNPIGFAVNNDDYFVSISHRNHLDIMSSNAIPVNTSPGAIDYRGKTYNIVQIGYQYWLKENLDVGEMIPGNTDMTDNNLLEKFCYADDPENCNKYGGLYQWGETMQYSFYEGAQGICPDGWHIPTKFEFETLLDNVGGLSAPLVEIGEGFGGGYGTNSTGFSALFAGGVRRYNDPLSLGDVTIFRSSTQSGANFAIGMEIWDYFTKASLTNQYYPLGLSVRCIQNGGITNFPPYQPKNPHPQVNNHKELIDNLNLEWECFDEEDDPLMYDIYLDTENPPTEIISENQSDQFISPTVENNSTYYWKVIAKDDHNNVTEGPIWKFGTSSPCPAYPTIAYGGKTYNTIQIGDQCWLRENLDVGTMMQSSVSSTDNGYIEKYCLNNDLLNCNKFGGLYSWDEAMEYSNIEGAQGICPEEWHIPTLADYENLINSVNENGLALQLLPGENESGFSALVSGVWDSVEYYYDNAIQLWSSKEFNDIYNAHYLRIYPNTPTVRTMATTYEERNSIRCIKDDTL